MGNITACKPFEPCFVNPTESHAAFSLPQNYKYYATATCDNVRCATDGKSDNCHISTGDTCISSISDLRRADPVGVAIRDNGKGKKWTNLQDTNKYRRSFQRSCTLKKPPPYQFFFLGEITLQYHAEFRVPIDLTFLRRVSRTTVQPLRGEFWNFHLLKFPFPGPKSVFKGPAVRSCNAIDCLRLPGDILPGSKLMNQQSKGGFFFTEIG